MNNKVYCIASAKGGSGKTTLTATFAAFLTHIGNKVLMIDGDASTNGLTLMYLKEVLTFTELSIGKKITPKGILEGCDTIDNNCHVVELKNSVYLLPATFNFTNTEEFDPEIFRSKLTRFLYEAREEYDYIFVDAQAGADIFAKISMSRDITDEVVIVSEYDPMSAAGVERIKGILYKDLTYDRTWVLLNKVLPEFVESYNDFLEVAKYLSPIPWDAEVVRAYARRRLALDFDRWNNFTIRVMDSLKLLIGENFEKEIKNWFESNEDAFIVPLSERYVEVRNQLVGLEKEIEKSYKKKIFYNMSNSISIIIAPISLIVLVTIFREGILKFLRFTGKLEMITILFFITISFVTASLFMFRKMYSKRFTEYDDLIQEKSKLLKQLEVLESLKKSDYETLIKKIHEFK